MTEVELAARVVEMLSLDHDVYQEVTTPAGVADIVARRGPVLWAIEVKKSLSLQVLGQALENAVYFNFVSVAVPSRGNRGKAGLAARTLLRDHGIGLILVGQYASEDQRARFNRGAGTKWVRLFEEQRTYAKAGNAEGARYTPFRGTRDALVSHVQRFPGCTVREAMTSIKHHYHTLSTAMSCARNYIQTGVIKEIRLEDGKLYPGVQA